MANNNTNITYLFGAGASIGNTKQWIDDFAKLPLGTNTFLHLYKLSSGIPITSYLDKYRMRLDQIIQDHTKTLWHKSNQKFAVERWLHVLLDNKLKRAFTSQLSPDTYGKALRISKRGNDYDNFKRELSSFINFFDALNFPDVRYPNLLANLIELESGKIPANINFLTYNFDAAPEKSYYNFIAPDDIKTTNMKILRKKYGIAASPLDVSEINQDASVWLKLHGSAGDVLNGEKIESLLQVGEPNFENFSNIVLPNPHYYNEIAAENNLERKRVHAFDTWAYLSNENNNHPNNALKSNLRFAWDIEHDDLLIELACKKLRATNVLVVVGYTFPPFNQKNDFKLLKALGTGTFDRLIVQLPGDEGNEVKQRILQMFKSLNLNVKDKQIIIIPDCSSFHIPVEFFSATDFPLLSSFGQSKIKLQF